MSYSIYIKNKKTGETVSLKNKHNIKGGTYCVGGTQECELNITYNYAKWFYKLWTKTDGEAKTTPFDQMFANNNGGIRSLYGKDIKEVLEILNDAIKKLKGDPDENYWKATEGNARASLFNLKLLCELALYDYPKTKMILVGD